MSGSLTAVRLVGEHGVGKSRLLREFLRGAAGAGDVIVQTGPDPWWAEVGNCVAAQGHHRSRPASRPTAAAPATGARPRPRRAAGLVDLFAKAATGRETRTPFWARAPQGSLSPADRRFIAAEALRWAIMRAQQNAAPRRNGAEHSYRQQPSSSRSQRVILAIDDLHAVDGASRAALADVIAEPPLAAMLIVATHIPGFDPGWRGGDQRAASTSRAARRDASAPSAPSSGLLHHRSPPRWSRA